MSVVELPDIRAPSNKIQTRYKRTESERIRKQSIYKSVDRLVKYGDLQSVIGQDGDYYPKILEDQRKIDEKGEVHSNLTELKKSCDNIKLSGHSREKEIEKMRKEIDSMTLQIEQYQLDQVKLQSKEINLKQQYETQIKNVQDIQYEKAHLEHILSRMKKDQLIYQQRANEYKIHLQNAMQKYNQETYKGQKIKELYQKTLISLKEVINGVAEQNKNRTKNLEKFQYDLKQRNDIQHKKDDRIKRQQEIAENAANDIKDSSQKRWRKLLLVHKFLNTFFKAKMQRGMDQYNHLEIAFQKIKASTGIQDANIIVQKFLTKEQTYSHLLISISDYEKKIEQLKNERGNLSIQLKQLKQESIDMDKEFNVEKIKPENEQDKIVNQYEEKATVAQLLSNKLNLWMKKSLKKLNLPVDSTFDQIAKSIKEKLLLLNPKEQQELINKQLQSSAIDLQDTEFQKRNTRVKAKIGLISGNQSFDQSSKFEESDFFEDFPQQNDELDQDDEEQLMDLQREEVKKKCKIIQI